MYLTFSMFLKNFLEFPKKFLEFLRLSWNFLHFVKIIGSATPQPACCHATTSLPLWTAEWIFDKMQEMLLWHTKQVPFHFQINFQFETSSLKRGPTQPSGEAGLLWCCRSNDFHKMHEILRNYKKF